MNKNNEYRTLFFLLTACLLYIAANCFLVLKRGNLYNLVECGKIVYCLQFNSVLIKEGFFSALQVFRFYPPAYFFLPIFLYGRFGSLQVFALSNAPYILLLMGSVYFLGKRISGGRRGALLALFVLFFYDPYISPVSRGFIMGFGLTAWMSVFFCLALYSRYLSNRALAAAAGIVLGLAMLTKPTAILYLPSLVFLFFDGRQEIKQFSVALKQRIAGNACLMMYLAGIIFSAWIFTSYNKGEMLSRYQIHMGYESSIGSGIPAYLSVILTSLGQYLVWETPLVLYLPFIIGFLLIKNQNKGFLLSWYLVPIALFAIFTGDPSYRYLLPVRPALALMTAAALVSIRNRIAKTAAVVTLLVVGMVIFGMNFNKDYRPGEDDYRRNLQIAEKVLSQDITSGSRVLIISDDVENSHFFILATKMNDWDFYFERRVILRELRWFLEQGHQYVPGKTTDQALREELKEPDYLIITRDLESRVKRLLEEAGIGFEFKREFSMWEFDKTRRELLVIELLRSPDI